MCPLYAFYPAATPPALLLPLPVACCCCLCPTVPYCYCHSLWPAAAACVPYCALLLLPLPVAACALLFPTATATPCDLLLLRPAGNTGKVPGNVPGSTGTSTRTRAIIEAVGRQANEYGRLKKKHQHKAVRGAWGRMGKEGGGAHEDEPDQGGEGCKGGQRKTHQHIIVRGAWHGVQEGVEYKKVWGTRGVQEGVPT